jgi:hypothetical protein
MERKRCTEEQIICILKEHVDNLLFPCAVFTSPVSRIFCAWSLVK